MSLDKSSEMLVVNNSERTFQGISNHISETMLLEANTLIIELSNPSALPPIRTTHPEISPLATSDI